MNFPAAPTFEFEASKPHDVNASVGENVTFQCNPYAEPDAKIVWYKMVCHLTVSARSIVKHCPSSLIRVPDLIYNTKFIFTSPWGWGLSFYLLLSEAKEYRFTIAWFYLPCVDQDLSKTGFYTARSYYSGLLMPKSNVNNSLLRHQCRQINKNSAVICYDSIIKRVLNCRLYLLWF